MSNNTCAKGRAGEFFVAFILSKHFHIESFLVDKTEDDLWVRHPDGNIKRVQVKSALPKKGRANRGAYTYLQRREPDCDYHAFVALDLDLAILEPSSFLRQRKHLTFYPEDFTFENMILSFQQTLDVQALAY